MSAPKHPHRWFATACLCLACPSLAFCQAGDVVATEQMVDDDFFALDGVAEQRLEELVEQDNDAAAADDGEDEEKKQEAAVQDQPARKKAKAAGGNPIQALFDFLGGRRAAQNRGVNRPQLADAMTLQSDEALDELEKKLPHEGKNFVKQYRPQFDAMCREELRFLHTISQLKRSQFHLIQVEAHRTARQALLQTVQVQLRMQRGWNGRQPPTFPDTQSLLEATLLKSAEANLSSDQFAAYRDEIEARRQFRREAGVESIIASLDRQLMMSPQQRQALKKPLHTSWQDEWQRNIQMLVNGNNYLPSLPGAAIRQLLSREQQRVFNSIPQNSSFFTGQPFGMMGLRGRAPGGQLEDELEFAPEELP